MRILATGAAVPKTGPTNEEVEKRLGLEPGWIERRTGIRRRPTAPRDEATSDLAVRAAENALALGGIDRSNIGLLILATSTPDHLLPPTGPLVARRLELRGAGAVDLAGACSGFLYALTLAAAYAQSSNVAALVIGANILSRRVNPQDAATQALFSDGAGAVIIAPARPSQLLGCHLGSDGSVYESIGVAAGGSREPLTVEAVAANRHLMSIRQGAALFRSAVRGMAESGQAALRQAGLGPESVDWWVPHQANARIIRDAGALLGIAPERTINIVGEIGNSSAATIPVALAGAAASGQLLPGQIVLMTAAGAGLTTAAVALRW